GGQLPLIERTRAGQARRRDLAVLADEVAQGVDVLVVDLFDAGRGEAAEALAAEQQRLLVALGLAILPRPAFSSRWWHGEPLSRLSVSCRSTERRDVKQQPASVARAGDEAGEGAGVAQCQRGQPLSDRADGDGPDLHRHLAHLVLLAELGLMLEPEVQ